MIFNVFLLEKMCARPDAPENGQVLGTDFSFGAAIQYICNPGFTIDGTESRTCQQDGQWGGVKPTCKGMHKQVLLSLLV